MRSEKFIHASQFLLQSKETKSRSSQFFSHRPPAANRKNNLLHADGMNKIPASHRQGSDQENGPMMQVTNKTSLNS